MAALRLRPALLLAALASLLLVALAGPAGAAYGRGRSQDTGRGGASAKVQMRTFPRRAVSSRSAALGLLTQSPANGATVSGTIAWEVRTSGTRVARVDFSVDGAVAWSDSSAPYAYSAGLDTTKLGDGRHALTATVYAHGSRPASTTVYVVVSNPDPAPAPNPAPSPAPAPQPAPEPAPAPEPVPTPQPEPEPAPSPEPEPSPAPASSIYWGAWIGSQLTGHEAPWDMTAVSSLEKSVGKNLSIVNFSSPFANCSSSTCSFYNFPSSEFNNIRSHGAIPFFSWGSQSIPMPSNLSEPNFQLSDVIEGRYDSYIRKWAEAAKAWGHPFFLRFNWEMNGNWFAWMEGVNGNKSGESVTAWRHVHDIFSSVGATNVSWVWCPNVDPGNQLRDLRSLYPGDAYVDWTGLDGYNFGTNPNRPDRWRTFDQLYRSTYDKITREIAPGKPMIVSEVGSSEYGGSKAAWITEMLSELPTDYPKIRGLLWFDKYDSSMDWPLDTSASATAAFAKGIQNPAYTSNSFGSLPFGTVQPSN
jgi:mannan endo-1,4-beta-mannosidase